MSFKNANIVDYPEKGFELPEEFRQSGRNYFPAFPDTINARFVIFMGEGEEKNVRIVAVDFGYLVDFGLNLVHPDRLIPSVNLVSLMFAGRRILPRHNGRVYKIELRGVS